MSERDWGGLRGIIDEARELAREERDRVEEACPLCGTPLDFNAQGAGNCPMGHWRSAPGIRGNASA